MRSWSRSLALVCALGLMAGGPLAGAGQAAGVPAADADCQAHVKLTKHYTVQQLQTALATMPADIKEYTPCPDIINHQLLVALGKLPPGSGGGGGSFLPVWLIVLLALLVLGGAGFG